MAAGIRAIWFSRFSADSKLLATALGGWDANEGGEARIWDAASGKQKLLLMVLFDFGMEVTGCIKNGHETAVTVVL